MAVQGTAVIYCDPCTYNKLIAQVQFWCLSCEEALCKSCSDSHKGMKATRNHRIITYEKSKEVTSLGHLISQQCKQHNKVLDLYCPNHDEPVCSLCISKNHRECKEMVSLDDVAKNVISSTSYSNLQRDISNHEENLFKVKTKRQQNLTIVETQESSIQSSVKEMRKKMDEHLDNLEKDLIQELAGTKETCKTTIKMTLADLEFRLSVASEMHSKISQLKEIATDVQLFLAIREIDKLVNIEQNWLQESLNEQNMNESSLYLNMEPMNNLLTLKSLGSVTIVSKFSEVQTVTPSSGEAQMSIKPIDKRIEKIKLFEKTCIKSSYKVKDGSLYFGCLICSTGGFMLVNYCKDNLEMFNGSGKHQANIPIPGTPSDMTEISNDCFAITFGNGRKIEIASIKISQYKTIKTIPTTGTCWGISYYDNKLAVKISNEGIHLYNINGTLLKKLETEETQGLFYNVTMMENIYCSRRKENTVFCCNQQGNVLWTFQDNLLQDPEGITTDSYGNVFVVGGQSKNIFVISHDGQGRELLKMEQTPISVSCDKVNNQLLVRTNEKVFLFDITFEK